MAEFLGGWKRSHTCGDLRASDIGKTVTLMGWVHRRRDHGGLVFVDLRDRYGITQIVFDPKLADKVVVKQEYMAHETKSDAHVISVQYEDVEKQSHLIRNEWVLAIRGVVTARPEGTVNPKLSTGEIEISCLDVKVLNSSLTPVFPIEDEVEVAEEVRLEYRYLDLRRPSMKDKIVMRHNTSKAIRSYMNSQNFLEIETPILIKNTPEGAREYVVPSRVYPGKFYVLPQSPQIFKQLSMVAGLDRYYQIARCFRDEDPRADRQPEFTQVDIEMSFIDEDDIYGLGEGIMKNVIKEVMGEDIETPFPRITFEESMNKYGNDKPDLRFDMPMVDVTAIAGKSDFKVFKDVVTRGDAVKALNAKGCADFSRKDIEDLTAFVAKYGAKGMAWFKVKDGKLDSNIVKYFNEEVQKEMLTTLKGEEGDLFLFGADHIDVVNESLGQLRVEIAKRKGLIEKGPKWAFCWVVDIPMFGTDEKGRIFSMNHPFTSPKEADVALLDTDPMKAKSKGYDIVLNGFEIGGGSIRIHDMDLQSKIFKILDISPEKAEERFGFLLKALSYGAPPHGGMAFGLDRFVMLMSGSNNIREVIAFPKTAKATDLMTGSPSYIDEDLMKELKIKIELEDLT